MSISQIKEPSHYEGILNNTYLTFTDGLPNANSLTLQFGYPNRDLTNPLEFTLIVF